MENNYWDYLHYCFIQNPRLEVFKLTYHHEENVDNQECRDSSGKTISCLWGKLKQVA